MSLSAELAVRTAGTAGVEFVDFYEEARRDVLPSLRRIDRAAADDLFHDAVLLALERWERVSTMEYPIAWLRTVAVRMAWRRSTRESRRSFLELAGLPPPHVDVNTADTVDLDRALTDLRPDHALAFRLTQLAGMDTASAASLLGVAESTVKVWLHRSRPRLAEQTTGLRGRWVAEAAASPVRLERDLIRRGHAAYVDAAMPLLVDRDVRWELHFARGKYVLRTDDGASMDQGDFALTSGQLSLRSVKRVVPGSDPEDARDIGTSFHGIDIDGDRLRLRLFRTDIQPTNGVPDIVYRQVYFDEIVYRWIGAIPRRSKFFEAD